MFRTLIVEDNSQFRKSMLQTLQGRFPFIHFHEVDDGEQALQVVDRWNPHLIFMDINMPSVNGLELTRTVKHTHADVVVIMLTSYDLPEYRQEAARCGADHFLVKSAVTNTEIFTLVNSVIASRFRTLVVAESDAFVEQMGRFLTLTWPGMVVVNARAAADARDTADLLEPNLVVLGNSRCGGDGCDALAADHAFGRAVVVSVGDRAPGEPCPGDYWLPPLRAVGSEMVTIINDLVSASRQQH